MLLLELLLILLEDPLLKRQAALATCLAWAYRVFLREVWLGPAANHIPARRLIQVILVGLSLAAHFGGAGAIRPNEWFIRGRMQRFYGWLAVHLLLLVLTQSR